MYLISMVIPLLSYLSFSLCILVKSLINFNSNSSINYLNVPYMIGVVHFHARHIDIAQVSMQATIPQSVLIDLLVFLIEEG